MATADGKVLTILFTDVEGSTELLSREGDRVAGKILRVHEQIVRTHIEEFQGRAEAFLGDGFMATFESPVAALDCAIEIQRSLNRHNQDVDRPVKVRIGLHLGEVTRREGQLYGRAVHAAARVMSEAAGGEILASTALVEAVDAATPVHVYRPGPVLVEGLSPPLASLSCGLGGRGGGRPRNRDPGSGPLSLRRSRCRASRPSPEGSRGYRGRRGPGAGVGRSGCR